MSDIWEILHKPDTVVFFDIDGTLTSYNYGRLHAHHELDGAPEFRDVNIYADCKRLKPLYDHISGHDVNRLFCISREPHGHEAWKSEMVERLYGIPASHCFYTLEAKEKPQIVMNKVKELFPDISPKSVVLMDDNDDTLGMYMAVGLSLNLDEAVDFLRLAGYALSPISQTDKVVEYFIRKEEYSVLKIDIVLFDYGLEPLSKQILNGRLRVDHFSFAKRYYYIRTKEKFNCWKKIGIWLKLIFPGAISIRFFESWQKRMFC